MVIYLVSELPRSSSGERASPDQGLLALLAANRVCLRYLSPDNAVGSYPTRFTFSLKGSFVSVVLSLRLRAVAVSNYRILCCPDFPLTFRQRPFFEPP